MRTQPWRPPDQPGQPRTVVLTMRGAQVLDALCRGKTKADMARDMFVSKDTVATHARRLYRELGARNAAQAVALACSGRVTVLVRVDAWRAPKVVA